VCLTFRTNNNGRFYVTPGKSRPLLTNNSQHAVTKKNCTRNKEEEVSRSKIDSSNLSCRGSAVDDHKVSMNVSERVRKCDVASIRQDGDVKILWSTPVDNVGTKHRLSCLANIIEDFDKSSNFTNPSICVPTVPPTKEIENDEDDRKTCVNVENVLSTHMHTSQVVDISEDTAPPTSLPIVNLPNNTSLSEHTNPETSSSLPIYLLYSGCTFGLELKQNLQSHDHAAHAVPVPPLNPWYA